jgi:hypothetical protein
MIPQARVQTDTSAARVSTMPPLGKPMLFVSVRSPFPQSPMERDAHLPRWMTDARINHPGEIPGVLRNGFDD